MLPGSYLVHPLLPSCSPQLCKCSDLLNIHLLPAMQKILKGFGSCPAAPELREGPWCSCTPGSVEGAREAPMENAPVRGSAPLLCNPSQEQPDLDRVPAIVLTALCF